MVVKKAWIPAKGTYSVGNSNDPFNPTVGDLTHTPQQPIKIRTEGHERAIPYKELLEDNPLLEKYLNVASLANLAHVHKSDRDSGSWMARGDPTEIAIQVFASRFDWNKERLTKGDNPLWTQIAEFPFDSDIKKMSVIFQKSGGDGVSMSVFTKGAVERVLGSCTHITWDERLPPTEMNDEFRDIILQNVDELASQGLRVLALASKDCSSLAGPVEGYRRAEAEKDLAFQGLIGLYDPPRPESANAVQECHQAGISVHMLTGDHIGTARAIAAQIGILPSNMNTLSRNVADSMVMTATEFDRLSDAEVDRLSVLPFVIARCSPHTKVRMIEALHRRKCFAAMTGDGVNDSPSLKKSDVGIAMGQSGSDVAKGASDIVLTDDNFASILNAVEEGRRMFDNIQKFVLHLLAENIALACVLLIGLIFKDQAGTSVFPVTPVEILWIIMITSCLPDMGLGVEIAAPDIMTRPPQSLKKGVFTLEVMIDMLVYGLWMAVLCLAAFVLVLFCFGDGQLGENCNKRYSMDCDTVFRARATTFVCLTWFALLLAWETVNMRRSFFRMQPRSTKYFTQWMHDVWRNQFLFWAIVAGFVTIFLTLYIPILNRTVFKHEGITWEWGVVLVEAFCFVLGVEAWKWAKRIYFRRRARKAATDGAGGRQDRTLPAFIAARTTDSEGDIDVERGPIEMKMLKDLSRGKL